MPDTAPKRSLRAIVAEYGGRLGRFIRGRVRSPDDADDILQDVWYQLSNIVDLDGIESVSGWLYQVARNRITDTYRRGRETPLSDLNFGEGEEDADLAALLLTDAETPEDQMVKDVFWDELQAALAELPDAQRQVFVQNELEGRTLQAIADQTGEPLKTIISRKRYAVQHLRQRLQTLYNDLTQ